jgi:hypothetical protein
MTKHVFKKSTSLTLAILIAVIAVAIPALAVHDSIKKSVKDSSGMEQNKSRAPSSEESVLLDLPEGLLDLEDNQVGRGIDRLYTDTEDQSDITQVSLHSYSDSNTNDPTSDPLFNAGLEGDENAKQIIEQKRIRNLRKDWEESEEYLSSPEERNNTPVEEKPSTQAKTPPTTQPTTAAPATTAAPSTTAPATTAPATTAATTKAPEAVAPAKGTFLLSIPNPNPNYVGRIVQVEDRAVLEGLIMGEFGNDYTGAVLVAQAIRDTMILTGIYNTGQIARQWGYTARIHSSVTDATKKAVAFVFDEGGSAVQHTVYYFYAAHLIYSSWHESQRFVVQHGGCRFFSSW